MEVFLQGSITSLAGSKVLAKMQVPYQLAGPKNPLALGMHLAVTIPSRRCVYTVPAVVAANATPTKKLGRHTHAILHVVETPTHTR